MEKRKKTWAFEGESLDFLFRKPFRCDDKELSALGWKNSFSQGIGITAPKARTRDKSTSH
ncbi:Casparian strip membrane protein [Salix suchowensis]|nr:Casparian strip membrane protein [Salix suchowensis]